MDVELYATMTKLCRSRAEDCLLLRKWAREAHDCPQLRNSYLGSLIGSRRVLRRLLQTRREVKQQLT